MENFTANKIHNNNEIIAQELLDKRKDLKLDILKISQKLNINVKYLKALENGQLNKLPAGLYGKKILQEYANFLKLDSDFLLELWEIETENKKKNIQKNLFSHKVPHLAYFLTIPKIIKNLSILLAVLICLTYLGYYIKNIIEAPTLIITSPADNVKIEENFVNIQGSTEPEANVSINNKEVLIDPQGNFSQKINLSNGLNTISIIAQKKYSKKNTVIKRILVNSGSE